MNRRHLALAILACAVFSLAAACGSGAKGDTPTTSAANTAASGTTAPGNNTSPSLSGPVSKYIVLREEMGKGYIVDIPATFDLDAKSYGKTAAFKSADEGEAALNQWGYLGGYETGLIPEGRLQALLTGSAIFHMEVHLFNDDDGAKKLFSHLDSALKANGAQAIKIDPVGNQSAAYTVVSGKVGTSNVDQVAHTVILRRGNLVAAVLTIGALPYMTIDPAHEVAAMIDQKALKKDGLITPTPTSNFTPPANSVPGTTSSTATPAGR